MNDHDRDAQWLARVGRGDAGAARELVAARLPRVLALAQRLLGNRPEAEEVAQETFLRAWKQAATWRPGEASFDTWLHRVALNLCMDRLRARVPQEPLGDEHGDVADSAPRPEQQLASRQQSRAVGAALAALPARQREAIVLQYYQGLSNHDAAQLMGLSVDALESLLARARRALKAQLQSHRMEGSP